MAVQNPPFTTVIAANATKRNTGTILGAGPITDRVAIKTYNRFTSLDLLTNNQNPMRLTGLQLPNHYNGVGFIQEATGIAISSITQSGNYTLITKSSHGLLVGTPVQVNATSVPDYNVIHTVKAINNVNSFQTDIRFSSIAGTPGTYSRLTGTFAVMAKRQYVASLVCTQLAGVANNALFMMSAGNNVMPYNPANPTYGVQLTGFDYITGVKTTGANWGIANPQWNITGNTTINIEPIPTRAIPGRLIFLSTGIIPTGKSYNPKTT
jgi:hypothetical protein